MDNTVSQLARDIASEMYERLKTELVLNPPMPRVWFSAEEAATYTRRTKRSLDAALAEGKGPKVKRCGAGKRVFHIRDLDAWMESQS